MTPYVLILHVCVALSPGSQISECHIVTVASATKAECLAQRRAAIDWHLSQPSKPGVMAECVEG
jgi:hypothetical protein